MQGAAEDGLAEQPLISRQAWGCPPKELVNLTKLSKF